MKKVQIDLPERGLIIRDPWVSLILSGKKSWELRTRATTIRGRIAIIRAGSGLVIGEARLIDCLPKQNRWELICGIPWHQVPRDQLDAAIEAGWVFPWVLENAYRYRDPVPYKHPKGAVTWVDLTKY